MSMKLSDTVAPFRGQIEKVNGNSPWSDRLVDMGVRPGDQVDYLQRSPLKGPLVVLIGSSFMALREEEAACLQVRPLP